VQLFRQFMNQSGAWGSIVAAMGCASCFPALGSIAAALGLGFLAQFEGLFINTLLPIMASIVIAIQVFQFAVYTCWKRLIAGITGPAFVLLTLYPLWSYGWSTYLFYLGLILMMAVAIWEIVHPAYKFCVKSEVS